jgi:uncharacterized protein (UPF0264 family)
MSRLLVSVRDASEAIEAVAGGASVIDVKEPSRGPLGRADVRAWRDVLEAVAGVVPVSVALGEITDSSLDSLEVPSDVWSRLTFAKLGLAGAAKGSRVDWLARWHHHIQRLGPGPSWVGVAYLDFEAASAPEPAAVAEAAARLGCSGLLLDTWDKSQPAPAPESGWLRVLNAWRQTPGRFAAVAGGLDVLKIAHLRRAGIEPDLFAARGAACGGGSRTGRVERTRVAELAQAAAIRLAASSPASTDRLADRPLAMQSASPTPVR